MLFSTRVFTFDKNTKSLIADRSELSLAIEERNHTPFFNDNLCLKSHKTGKIVEFRWDDVVSDNENEELYTVYIPMSMYKNCGIEAVKIFND